MILELSIRRLILPQEMYGAHGPHQGGRTLSIGGILERKQDSKTPFLLLLLLNIFCSSDEKKDWPLRFRTKWVFFYIELEGRGQDLG